ncbi:beta-propeller fold lactonase family protein [Edaphobacter paludis]|uniref:Beta-propeller fold lactonase family protein n=1 Tax=Edaphobacter paludis TaxID=3035702 RepID=A0AAU7D0J7_9BACT
MSENHFEKLSQAAKMIARGLRMMGWAERTRWLISAVAVVGLTVLTGCGGFFVPVVPVPPGSTGNFVYVANTTGVPPSGANSATGTVSGFAVGTGKLTGVSGSPLTVGYTPLAMTVTRDNKFLYVATLGNINVYTINADGSLTGASGGTSVAIANVVSMDVSPDGQWLLALDGTSLQAQIDVFQINTSTGALAVASNGTLAIPNAVIVPKMLKISPNGAYVFAALGSGGDAIFTFDTSTGTAIGVLNLTVSKTTSDNGLAVDSASANLYIARSGTGGGVHVFGIGSGGTLNEIAASPFDSGGQAYSVVLDNTGKYAYAANRTNGTIYGYSIGAGAVLTALEGSPYTSGKLVTSLGMDSTGNYLLAAAFGGGPDLSMYSFDTTTPGKLILATSTTTGTDPTGAIAVALTH